MQRLRLKCLTYVQYVKELLRNDKPGGKMKRSEMERKLFVWVQKNTNWCFDDSLMFAQEVLDLVEKAGMLPPGYEPETGATLETQEVKDLLAAYWYYVKLEWEPEDG